MKKEHFVMIGLMGLLVLLVAGILYYPSSKPPEQQKKAAPAEKSLEVQHAESCGERDVVERFWVDDGLVRTRHFCKEVSGRLVPVEEDRHIVWQDVHSQKTGDAWMDQAVQICLAAGYIGAIDLTGLNCVDKDRHVVPFFHPMRRLLGGGEDRIYAEAESQPPAPAK